MTEAELRADSAVRVALLNQLNACGMHPLPNTETTILRWFAEKSVSLDASHGYLALTQSDGNAAVPSSACETLRREHPEFFAADATRDKVSCKQDLERGTQTDIYKAKSAYIAQHGLAAWEALPKTKDEAVRKSAPVSLDMTRAEYLALTLSERARFAGAVGAEGVSRIMARRG